MVFISWMNSFLTIRRAKNISFRMNKKNTKSSTHVCVLFLDYLNGYSYGCMWFVMVQSTWSLYLPYNINEANKRIQSKADKNRKSTTYSTMHWCFLSFWHRIYLFIIFRFDHSSAMYFDTKFIFTLTLLISFSSSSKFRFQYLSLFIFYFFFHFCLLSITLLWPMAVVDVLELPSHCSVPYFSFTP